MSEDPSAGDVEYVRDPDVRIEWRSRECSRSAYGAVASVVSLSSVMGLDAENTLDLLMSERMKARQR